MRPTIRRAQTADAIHFALRLRSEDALELLSAHPGVSLFDILHHSIKTTTAYVLQFEDEPPCVLFGINTVRYFPELGVLGVVWMVCTPAIHGRAISILREARHWFTAWKHTHRTLCNWVETRNTLHIRWLRYLGCSFGQPTERNGVEVIPFYY